MKILIVNDDGFRGKGLHALIRALKDDHDLMVVVSDSEQS
ncbi:MAG: 5'/3'-nucleotidase SurE, partial [Clostridia bacterium]